MTNLLQTTVDELRDRTLKISANLKLHGPAYQRLLLAMKRADVEVKSVQLWAGEIDCNIAGGRAVLTAAFRVLRAAGFEPANRPDEKATSFSTFFNHPNGARVWLAFTSTVCTRVQVGTEMIETPIYEIRCEEAA